jgi:recombination protein RecA
MDEKQKNTALKTALSQLEKKYGMGTIMKLGDRPKTQVGVIPTGALNLDSALGIGGIPKGRITEIYGAEASGKTTLTLHIAAEAQKQNGVIAFVDAEHALDPIYAKRIGVNTDEMLISQPDGGEQALEIVETLVRSNAVDLIILDSVAALVTRQEIDGEMGDSHVGLQARLMSQALRKLTAIVSKSNTAVIFINQTRMKIGAPPYMNPETTTGGVALKFYSSVRMEVRNAGSIKDTSGGGINIIGNNIRVKVVKNKFAPPFKTVEFPLIYGLGISKQDILINLAVDHDIVKKSGSWFSYNEQKIGQGMEKVKTFFTENPGIREDIETAVKRIIFPTEEQDDSVQEDK